MADLNTPVRPGQVISSELFNLFRTTLNDALQRLSNLEQGGGGTTTIIDHLDPPSQLPVGQILTIFGAFDFPPPANTVTVDGNPITTFRPESNNLKLLFIVPSTITVPPNGTKSAVVQVQTSRGKDQRTYLLLPGIPSSVPPPSITSVGDPDNSNSPTLRVAGRARITGTNFAANPTDNIIRLKFQIGLNQVIYPKQGQPALAIDAGQSSVTQIMFTMPSPITEIGLGTSPATLEVQVGTAIPGALGVTVLRVT